MNLIYSKSKTNRKRSIRIFVNLNAIKAVFRQNDELGASLMYV